MGMQESVGEASVGMMMMREKKRREEKGERVEFETVQTLYTSSEGARGVERRVDEANAREKGRGGGERAGERQERERGDEAKQQQTQDNDTNHLMIHRSSIVGALGNVASRQERQRNPAIDPPQGESG
jgi:hypothetical protein